MGGMAPEERRGRRVLFEVGETMVTVMFLFLR